MPTYEYVCSSCMQKFEIYMTLAEKKANKNPECPNCKSTDTIQVFGNITIIGNRSSSPNLPPVCSPGAAPSCCK